MQCAWAQTSAGQGGGGWDGTGMDDSIAWLSLARGLSARLTASFGFVMTIYTLTAKQKNEICLDQTRLETSGCIFGNGRAFLHVFPCQQARTLGLDDARHEVVPAAPIEAPSAVARGDEREAGRRKPY